MDRRLIRAMDIDDYEEFVSLLQLARDKKIPYNPNAIIRMSIADNKPDYALIILKPNVNLIYNYRQTYLDLYLERKDYDIVRKLLDYEAVSAVNYDEYKDMDIPEDIADKLKTRPYLSD